MLAAACVYLTVQQLERLRREENQSETVRQALEMFWAAQEKEKEAKVDDER